MASPRRRSRISTRPVVEIGARGRTRNHCRPVHRTSSSELGSESELFAVVVSRYFCQALSLRTTQALSFPRIGAATLTSSLFLSSVLFLYSRRFVCTESCISRTLDGRWIIRQQTDNKDNTDNTIRDNSIQTIEPPSSAHSFVLPHDFQHQ